METFRFTLESGSKKFTCPNPDCHRKSFVRYIDLEKNNQYLNDNVGRCDHQLSCGYHYKPKQYFDDNKIGSQKLTYIPKLTINSEPKYKSYINPDLLQKYTKKARENNFLKFLLSLFDEEVVKEVLQNYLIGTSFYWYGATIFWQIDEKINIRTGKVMLYNSETGKQVKKPFNHVNWIHKTESLLNFNLSQCLFGLHLINEYPNKTIAIVKREKTAVIMSIVYSSYLWLACGSLNMIKESIFSPIFNKKIILFPDISQKNKSGLTAYDLWKDKANQLNLKGYDIKVSKTLYSKASNREKKEGYDVADYFIESIKKGEYVIHSKEKPKTTLILKKKKKKILDDFRSKNSQIDNLIKTFSLIIS